MIMACVVLVAFFWGATYLVCDLLYNLADPRVRLGGGAGVSAARVPSAAGLPVAPSRAAAAAPGASRQALGRFLRNRPAAAGAVPAAAVILAAVFAPLIACTPYDYSNLADALSFPGGKYPLGTDEVGRDFLSWLVYGARTSIWTSSTPPTCWAPGSPAAATPVRTTSSTRPSRPPPSSPATRPSARTFGLTYLFIAHDLAVVGQMSDRVAVMYLGRIVELAETAELFRRPLHPDTQALLSAVPYPDPAVEQRRRRIIPRGEVPSPVRPPAGCRFHAPCPIATERCRAEVPALRPPAAGHVAACHHAEVSQARMAAQA